MGWFEITQNVITAIVSGGVAGGIIAAYLQKILAKEAREVSYLRAQLEKLYGPLRFYVSQNEMCIAHVLELSRFADEEYGGRAMTDRDRQEHQTNIEVRNDYMARVEKNNAKILEVLTNAYGFIDLDDMELFGEFTENQARMEVELDEAKRIRLPLELYTRMKGISYMPPESAERVTKRFLEKHEQLKKLGG